MCRSVRWIRTWAELQPRSRTSLLLMTKSKTGFWIPPGLSQKFPWELRWKLLALIFSRFWIQGEKGQKQRRWRTYGTHQHHHFTQLRTSQWDLQQSTGRHRGFQHFSQTDILFCFLLQAVALANFAPNVPEVCAKVEQITEVKQPCVFSLSDREWFPIKHVSVSCDGGAPPTLPVNCQRGRCSSILMHEKQICRWSRWIPAQISLSFVNIRKQHKYNKGRKFIEFDFKLADKILPKMERKMESQRVTCQLTVWVGGAAVHAHPGHVWRL